MVYVVFMAAHKNRPGPHMDILTLRTKGEMQRVVSALFLCLMVQRSSIPEIIPLTDGWHWELFTFPYSYLNQTNVSDDSKG